MGWGDSRQQRLSGQFVPPESGTLFSSSYLTVLTLPDPMPPASGDIEYSVYTHDSREAVIRKCVMRWAEEPFVYFSAIQHYTVPYSAMLVLYSTACTEKPVWFSTNKPMVLVSTSFYLPELE